MPRIKQAYVRRGFTLVEVIVGVALLAIVFTGIFGAYRLGLKVVGLSKSKIIATAIANGRIEKIRNLPYESVGIAGASLPDAAGVLDRVTTQTSNSVVFTVTTDIKFAVDPTDGQGAGDTCNWDYKKVKVTVSWGGAFPGQAEFFTDVLPPSQVQETQTCLSQPGGVLAVTAFDAAGFAVPSPTIGIYDISGTTLIGQATPANGKHSFALPSGTYRAVVSKNNYSTARTYDTSEVAVPDNPHPTVFDARATEISLSVDRAAQISVDGISTTGENSFADPFEDQSKLSQMSNTQVVADSITLSGPPYPASGYAISSAIAPSDLVAWKQLVFTDSEPASTKAIYQVLYYNGSSWVLVPNSVLGSNSTGYTSSPVSLSGLSVTAYPQIKIKTTLTSSNPASTPAVASWQIVWTSNVGDPIGGVALHLQGNKTIGTDASGNEVYKYSQDSTLGGNGHLDLAGMEWDSYTFSVNTSGLSLAGTDPRPQPIGVDPGATVAVKLYIQAQNSLLVTVQDDTSLDPVFSATVRLTNSSMGYDKTQNTDQQGQTFFAPLSSGTYNLNIQAIDYNPYAGSVSVSGQSTKIISLHHAD